MKNLKRATALLLVLLILATGSISAYAADAVPPVESIEFYSTAQEDLQMTQLAQPGDDKILLCASGKTDFSIVIPEDCSQMLRDAVAELQSLIAEMTGTAIPVISEKQADADSHNFCIDSAMGTLRPDENETADGYQLMIGDKDISVCGADEAGTINGIYDFAENKLGCMFLTPEDTYVPSQETVRLPMRRYCCPK